MVASPKINIADFKQLRTNALPKVTRDAFLRCIEIPFFSQQGWYLAGGTALSLQAGHRMSVDLDFFTPEKSFDEKNAEETLSIAGKWKTSSISRGTVYGELNGAKISLIAYPFFCADKPFLKIGTVSILKLEDIAVMKIVTISQRGKKRDFFDLYWLSFNAQPLRESIEAVQRQYSICQNLTHILKSLVYFEDAETDPDPEVFFDADWKKVKKFFTAEIPTIAKRLIK